MTTKRTEEMRILRPGNSQTLGKGAPNSPVFLFSHSLGSHSTSLSCSFSAPQFLSFLFCCLCLSQSLSLSPHFHFLFSFFFFFNMYYLFFLSFLESPLHLHLSFNGCVNCASLSLGICAPLPIFSSLSVFDLPISLSLASQGLCLRKWTQGFPYSTVTAGPHGSSLIMSTSLTPSIKYFPFPPQADRGMANPRTQGG